MVFVTVGSTCFDALVKSVNSQQVKDELWKRGYTNLLIQIGRGFSIPSKSSGEDGSLAVDYFTFSPSIADYMSSASLVISHAGSRSIFETLRLGKPLIDVGNEDLMDNHQSELAEVLGDQKNLFCATPQTLHQTIRTMDLGSLLPYPPGDAMPIAKMMRSGSIFETLRLGKPLIVVANEDLMDNQSELAEVLADQKHLFCATPQTLHQTIRTMDLGSLLPYPPGDAMPIAKLMILWRRWVSCSRLFYFLP